MKPSQIRQEATQLLREDGNNFSKLVLINVAVTTGIFLLLNLSSSSQYLFTTGGFEEMDNFIRLATVLTFLQLVAGIVVAAFWDAGLIFCSLRQIRGQRCTPQMLTEGFRRWNPVTASLFVRFIIYSVITSVCVFIVIILLSSLPFSSSVIADMINTAGSVPDTPEVRTFLAVFLLLFMPCSCALLVPRLYLHRQTVYRIMDDEFCNGPQALEQSCLLMNDNRVKLFFLDLSFWWFYLLDMGIMILANVDLLADAANIPLPLNDKAASLIFPIVGQLARLLLYWLAKPKLLLSYALFYRNIHEEILKKSGPSQPKRRS